MKWDTHFTGGEARAHGFTGNHLDSRLGFWIQNSGFSLCSILIVILFCILFILPQKIKLGDNVKLFYCFLRRVLQKLPDDLCGACEDSCSYFCCVDVETKPECIGQVRIRAMTKTRPWIHPVMC